MKTNLKEELPFCECGCGERVKKPGNRFINHHNTKGKNNPMLGKNHLKEVIQKMSKNRKGLYTGEDHHMFGKNHPEETRQKMSDNHVDFSGENNPMYGKKQSEETRQKMSDNHANVSGENNPMFGKGLYGEDNPCWKGGASSEPYCFVWTNKEFKQAIRNRDCNIAWDIGYWRKGGLSLHHIDYDKKNCAFNNIITVSVGMNSAVNIHREFYTEWFQTAMNHRLGYEYGT